MQEKLYHTHTSAKTWTLQPGKLLHLESTDICMGQYGLIILFTCSKPSSLLRYNHSSWRMSSAMHSAILRMVSAHLMDRGRYHNPLCAVQHSGGREGDITSTSGLLLVHLRTFSFVEGYPQYLGGIISTAKVAHYNGGKIDHKRHHSINDIITVLMISSQYWWYHHSIDDIITVLMISSQY